MSIRFSLTYYTNRCSTSYGIARSSYPEYPIKPRIWLHKGFNGEKILKSDYITKAVIPEIRNLIDTDVRDRVRAVLKSSLIIGKLRALSADSFRKITDFKVEEHDAAVLQYFWTCKTGSGGTIM